MKYRSININLLVIIAGLLIGGCAARQNSLDDETSFAGFRSHGKISGAIKDRSEMLWVQSPREENYQTVDRLDPEDMQPSAASQYNLIYHLYGPDYRYPYGNRMWSSLRRRHHNLPWGYGYGYDPFYDPYYQDPFWGMNYRRSWGYNSWTDPYFDFYFHDPFSYSNYYSYQFDPIYWGNSRYYRTGSSRTYANKSKEIKQRRRRGSGDSQYVRKSSPTSTASSAGQSSVKAGSTGTTSSSSTSSTGYRVKSTGKSSSSSKSSETKSSSKKKQSRRRGSDD
ncbi:hypothetical protein ACFL6E_03425 [Candidatus Neomarinimicrobiota bacterium]